MRSEAIWLSTAQVAERTGRHPVTVRRALEADELHGGQPKARGSWRVHRDCADAWALGEPCPHRAPNVTSIGARAAS